MVKRIVLLAWLGLATVACASDECDEMFDKYEECGLFPSSGIGVKNCSGYIECEAKCVNAASCADLKGETTDSKYLDCETACNEKYQGD